MTRHKAAAIFSYIEMAPMQGLTGHIFRAVYQQHFKGVDHCYSPFVRMRHGQIQAKDQRELAAGLGDKSFTPQIIAADPDEALHLLRPLADMGYRAVNLNLGCPYPMQTRRQRGAGLLPYPDKVQKVLEAMCAFTPSFAVSVKTRLGLQRDDELAALVPLFNSLPLTSLIVHPRNAQQMYAGQVNWDLFAQLYKKFNMDIVVNGDMNSREDAQNLQLKFPGIKGLMIGRGLLRDPFLPAAIQGQKPPQNRLAKLGDFHHDLFTAYKNAGLSPAHLVDRMRPFWAFFADNFAQRDKVAKRFRKVRSLEKYQNLVLQLFAKPVQ